MRRWANQLVCVWPGCGWARLAALLCILGTGLLGALEAGAATEVRGLRLGEHPDKSRIVLDLSNETPYALFTLADPYRIVIDLEEVDWSASRRSASASIGLITGYRFGLFQAGNSRLVLDLSGPARVVAAYFLPAAGEDADKDARRLVIDLVASDRAGFLASASMGPPARRIAKAAPPPAAKPPAPPAEAPDTMAMLVPPPAAVMAPAPPAPRVIPEIDMLPTPKPGKPQLKIPRRRTVMIDPGHGGIDPGATADGGMFEKRITLDVARRLRVLLGATGRYRVLMTRDSDVFVRLSERVAKARDSGADLFISIHADTIDLPKLRGASVYTLSEQASDKEAEALAEQENSSDTIAGLNIDEETDEVVRSILIDLAQRETMNKSVRFAMMLLPELGRVGALLKNSHRYAGFRVLKAPDVPSVLVELGLLSNHYDAQLLTTNPGRQKLAVAIKKAVDVYFRDQ